MKQAAIKTTWITLGVAGVVLGLTIGLVVGVLWVGYFGGGDDVSVRWNNAPLDLQKATMSGGLDFPGVLEVENEPTN